MVTLMLLYQEVSQASRDLQFNDATEDNDAAEMSDYVSSAENSRLNESEFQWNLLKHDNRQVYCTVFVWCITSFFLTALELKT